MTETTLVSLLSGNLMFESQLEAALNPSGITVASSRDPDMLPETDLVLIDLNNVPEERLAALGRFRDANPELTLVAFCNHGDKELRRQAMEAGASYVITNKYLPQAALRLATTGDVLETDPDHEP